MGAVAGPAGGVGDCRIDHTLYIEGSHPSRRSGKSLDGMTTTDADSTEVDKPWPQQLLESPWLLAGAALLFFTLSYIVWGLIDLMSVVGG